MRAPAFLLRFFLCVLLCLGVGCSHPKVTPLGTAQLFFDQLHRGEMQSAFENSSFSFQAQQNLKFFQERVREYGLGEAEIALSPISSDAKTAKFKADITKKNGIKYVLQLTLDFQDGVWRVYSLRPPRNPATGISEDRFSIVGHSPTLVTAARKRVPSDAEVRKLVNDSMLLFSDAIQTESFGEFYEFTSAAWQKELTEQKLQNAFHAFIEKKVDMSGIVSLDPIFDTPPEIGSDGFLAVSGYYKTKPYEVHFALRYIWELPEWKLLGLNSYLKKVEELESTTPATK